ncbi:MAG: tetratricopeptide repeat protein [Propionibacteriaceae bacterium]|jgi:tetratricopeptide (TPR) repeat protein|nr:tetratricopeptide repeat protein [Propionibacteriaceae bacterium]
MGLWDRLGGRKAAAAETAEISSSQVTTGHHRLDEDAALAERLWASGRADTAIGLLRGTVEQARHTLGPQAEPTLRLSLRLAEWLLTQADQQLADGQVLVALRRDMERRGTGVIDLAGFEATLVAAYTEPTALLDQIIEAGQATLAADQPLLVEARRWRQSLAERDIAETASQLTAQAVDALLDQTRREVVKRLRTVSRDQARREAETVVAAHRQLAAQAEAEQGADDPATLQAQYTLAWDIYHLGNFTDALNLAEQVWQRRLAVFGPDHTETIRSRYQIACIHGGLDQFDRAIGELDSVIADFSRVDGPTDTTTLTARRLQADLIGFSGDYTRAAQLAAEVLSQAQEHEAAPEVVEEAEVAADLWLRLA